MSKLHGCPCGAVQSDVAFPTPNKVHIITDTDLDTATNWTLDTLPRDAFDAVAKEGFFCYNCGRLLLLDGERLNGGLPLRVFEECGVNHRSADETEGARPTGFYWVTFGDGQRTIAEHEGAGNWSIIGSDEPFKDRDFESIDSRVHE